MRTSGAEVTDPVRTDERSQAAVEPAGAGLAGLRGALALVVRRVGASRALVRSTSEEEVVAELVDPAGSTGPQWSLELERAGREVGRLELVGGTPARAADAEGRILVALLTAELDADVLRREAWEEAATRQLLRDTAEQLTSVLEIDAVLERLAGLLRRAVDHQLFSVLLWDEEAEVLETVFSRTFDGGCGRRWKAELGEGVCGIAARDRRLIRVGNVLEDERYLSCGDDATRSELAVPLLVQDRLIGILDLEAHREDAFGPKDECLLRTLASSIAIALDNSRLHQEVQRRERRLARDLEAARKVHEALLPRQTPWVPGLQVAVAYRSARELGGDLYDVLPWGDDRAAFAVGDVAGKGAASALYGALALGALRAHAGAGDCDPRAVLEHLDAELRHLRAGRRFLAFAFADFDCPTRRLRIANAGLPAPLLVRDGEIRELDLPGLPLGTLSDAERGQLELELEEGDVLLLVSDGIEEARDAAGATFGPAHLYATIRAAAGGSAREIAEAVVDAADDWAERITDDRTVLVARVTPGCAGSSG